MASFDIDPEVRQRINAALSSAFQREKVRQTWHGRFAVPLAEFHSLFLTIDGLAGVKPTRPIDVFVDKFDGEKRVVEGRIDYGPVKGANKTDMVRFLARFNGQVTESLGTTVQEI